MLNELITFMFNMRIIISVRPFVLLNFIPKFSRYPFIFNHYDCNKLVDDVFYAWFFCAPMFIVIQLQKVLLDSTHPLSSSICSWAVTCLSSHISRLGADPPKKRNHVCLIATKLGQIPSHCQTPVFLSFHTNKFGSNSLP